MDASSRVNAAAVARSQARSMWLPRPLAKTRSIGPFPRTRYPTITPPTSTYRVWGGNWLTADHHGLLHSATVAEVGAGASRPSEIRFGSSLLDPRRAEGSLLVVPAPSLSGLSVHPEVHQRGAEPVVGDHLRYFHLGAHVQRLRDRARNREQSVEFRYVTRVVRRKIELVYGAGIRRCRGERELLGEHLRPGQHVLDA